MQDYKVLLVAAIAVTVAAIGVNRLPRLDVPMSHSLPIEHFPKSISSWQAVEDVPVDPSIKEVLPDATIVERRYRRSDGVSLDLLLLTSDNEGEFHDPSKCFPAQGWSLAGQTSAEIAGQTLHQFHASFQDQHVLVSYWRVRDLTPPPSPGSITSAVLPLRNAVTHDEGWSLLVRVISPGDPQGEAAARDFIQVISEPVHALFGSPNSAVTSR